MQLRGIPKVRLKCPLCNSLPFIEHFKSAIPLHQKVINRIGGSHSKDEIEPISRGRGRPRKIPRIGICTFEDTEFTERDRVFVK